MNKHHEQRSRLLRRYGVVLVAGCAVLIGILFTFQALFDQRALIDKESKINIWFLAQTEIEYLRFRNELTAFMAGEPGADRAAVLQNMELFWSRLDVLLHGKQSASLRQVKGLRKTVVDALAALKTIEPMLDKVTPTDRITVRAVQEKLAKVHDPLHEVVERALIYDADMTNDYHRLQTRYFNELIAVFGLMLSGMVGLFILFYAKNRETQRLLVQSDKDREETGHARNQLLVAMRSISEGFILYDGDDRVVLFNERYRDLHKAQAGILRNGVTFRELLRESAARGSVDVDDIDAWVERCVAGHRSPGAPFESQLSDGTWLMISEQRTDTGHIVGVHTDITELKRRELERTQSLENMVDERTREIQDAFGRLRESERNFRLLIDSVTDYAIYMLDPDGHITSWNPCAARIKGYSSSEVLGRHFSIFYTDDDRNADRPTQALDTARSTGKYVAEGWRVRKGGERFWASVVIDTMRDETGNIAGFVKITHDMTERRQMEEMLRQSQKMRAVGQLTGGIAHDFNNLLTVVIGNLSLLEAQCVGGTSHTRRISEALAAAERGAALTQRLLAFARQQRLDPSSVDTVALVNGMRDLITRSIGPAIDVVIKADRDVAPALVDRNQLESIVLNLCINARDAMNSDGTITIDLRNANQRQRPRDLAEGAYVVISVTDTGSGMTQETLQRAFEPFFTTKQPGKGTGLGLSMVHGIVTQSGGTACIQSEPGKGTTVEIWLPVAKVSPLSVRTEIARPSTAIRRGSVMLCDDDDGVRDLLAEALRDYGYTVTEAGSGDVAISAIRDGMECDVLIVDLLMPGMRGDEVITEVRHLRPKLPAMLITGCADANHAADDSIILVHKPFRPTKFVRRVDEILSSRSQSPIPSKAG